MHPINPEQLITAAISAAGFPFKELEIDFNSSSLYSLYQVRGAKGPARILAAKLVQDSTMAADEADGLRYLAEHGALVPDVYYPIEKSELPVLLMEFIDRSGESTTLEKYRKKTSSKKKHSLIDSLIEIYKNVAKGGFGYSRDNWIGNLRQKNESYDRFDEFWWHSRILPQYQMAFEKGLLEKKDKQLLQSVVLPRLAEWRPASIGPRVIHGDLWSGNVLRTAEADYLIDPSVARSVPEQDLAMLQLFGSPVSIRDLTTELDSIGALGASPSEVISRLDFFQLYPLLVHVNIFGKSYVPELKAVLKKYS